MKPTLHIVLLAAALIAFALLASAWRSARRDTAQLNTTLASQNAAMQQDEALDRDIPTSGGNK